ncbi:hypothetical protein PQR57_17145 [Paraburkholderia dipogonis]|uniref:Tail fiber protein n=1 Tax=Paraburkholderia dipogonis TaxID=1211383 RepID=A0ABW9ASB4_9BURK
MFRIDDATAASSLPTPEAAGTEGYFTEGNPATGTPATLERASWFNMVQEELRAIVVAGGLTPSKTTYTQVRDAILQLIQGGAGVTPIIGSVRNLAMTVATASATATITADEIVIGSALGGSKLTLGAFNKSINLATVGVNAGVGGMDTGTAPANSFVGIYGIGNPLTGAAALLGQSANGVILPNVYGGGHMPAGYTESALLTVVPTNASSQFSPCVVMDRAVDFNGSSILSTSTTAASPTIVNNLVVPLNAKNCTGFMQIGNSAAASVAMALLSSSAGTGTQSIALTLNASGSIASPFNKLKITVGQRVFYTGSSSAGTPTFSAQVTSYEI